MNGIHFILRSLRFYWRTHLGVLLGCATAGAILAGALAVGDSIRHTLRRQAAARLGGIGAALNADDRFFRAALADDLGRELHAAVAPALLLRGALARPDGSARVNDVQVLGVEARFWSLGGAADPLAGAAADEAVVNLRLAQRLGVRTGDVLVLRIEPPAFISRDAPLSGRSETTIALRLRVRTVAGDDAFGRFGLRASQTPPCTVFLPLATLQERLQRTGRANLLLTAATADVDAALRRQWTLADAGLEFRALPSGGAELRTERIFLDPAVESPALTLQSNACGVLTYFVNELRLGGHATPYSFVTATADAGLQPGEIAVNTWLATDLGARPGDEIRLRYFAIGDRRDLIETGAVFRVARVLPTIADSSWTPAFPGLAEVRDCRAWAPGIPIANDRLRPKDEEYWRAFRGTPKAFIALADGQRLWGNRFGRLTAVRYPAAAGTPADLAQRLRAHLDPAALGLFFVNVRDQAARAGAEGMDFGQLFAGFSLFLIVAAVLLTALLFAFNIEQRSTEIGLLRAVGFTPRRVRALLWGEGMVLAAAGTLAGLALGVLYTRAALLGLSTIWSGATGMSALLYHAQPSSLAIGAALNLLAAGVAMRLVLRRQMRCTPVTLLTGEISTAPPPPRRRAWGAWLGLLCFAGAIGLLATAGSTRESAETFFSAGALLLTAGLAGCHQLLAARGRARRPFANLAALGARNLTRRRGRSLTVIATLSSGVFMVVAVSAFHGDPRTTAGDRHAGTGGFALFARSALPVYEDLNRDAGRRAFGLDDNALRDVAILPLRVRDGDDASCLNLNRAQQPLLWGVQPEELARRDAFAFASPAGAQSGNAWKLLDHSAADGAVPAIGDEQTVTWALEKKQGDTLAYTDEQGRPFKLRIVAVLSGSILQGGLLISEREFIRRFPAAGGYRAFLIDAPPARAPAVAQELTRALQDRGMEVQPAWQRLADFMAVENTYLAIFQALGGLGLILGSVGLGIVLLRNMLERRRELAILLAVGFRRADLRRMIFREHANLLLIGLGMGLVAALVAICPALRASGPGHSAIWLALMPAGMAMGGLAAILLAVRAALRGPLVEALRDE